jgi:murein DD-endopeptidase MepM/ murein hydrolase activator NlpD
VRTNSFSGRAVSFIGDDGQEYGAANAPHRAAHREFLARHEGDQGDWYNSGVELYADYGDPVVACESGTVVAFEPFWGDLHRVLLSCASGAVIGYAGLEADSLDLLGLKSGMTVKAGQQVGTVGQVENGQAMLMFETYVAATRTGAVVRDTPAAAAGRLLDPTAYLIALAKGGR